MRKLPFVSLIHPSYARERDDKVVNPTDLRLSQVGDIVPIKNMGATVARVVHPDAELLVRDVYTKSQKGHIMVRTVLAWETNMEVVDRSSPTYVVVHTDYSVKRRTPLKKDVRVANMEEQIMSFVEEYRDNKYKRGWKAAAEAS